MARTVYVDCVGRDRRFSVEAVLKQVRFARPGTTVLVVRSDSARLVGMLRDWASMSGVRGTIAGEGGTWEARLYLLPDDFGSLPEASRYERFRGAAHRPRAMETEVMPA